MKRSLRLWSADVKPATRVRRRVLPKDMPDVSAFLRGEADRDALPKEHIDLGAMLELPPYLPSMSGEGRKVSFASVYLSVISC